MRVTGASHVRLCACRRQLAEAQPIDSPRDEHAREDLVAPFHEQARRVQILRQRRNLPPIPDHFAAHQPIVARVFGVDAERADCEPNRRRPRSSAAVARAASARYAPCAADPPSVTPTVGCHCTSARDLFAAVVVARVRIRHRAVGHRGADVQPLRPDAHLHAGVPSKRGNQRQPGRDRRASRSDSSAAIRARACECTSSLEAGSASGLTEVRY